jgi:hypothetical protein
VPGLLYLLSIAGKRLSGISRSIKEIFFMYAGTLLPLGLLIWIAFVIPMLFVNVTFIGQSLSDPFGWGWDFFGTANIPWHQFLPQYVPWFQAVLILLGLHLSLRNSMKMWKSIPMTPKLILANLPIGLFLITVAIGMLVFFTN